MREHIQIAIKSPWKAFGELGMYIIKPFVYLYLHIHGVKIGKNAKFYGFPRVMRYRGSKIVIGDNFEDRNWKYGNPLGINHATILCTWSKAAVIRIGNDVGISGGSMVSDNSIEIGDGTLVGANSTIIDTDFHPIKSSSRRYDKNNIKSVPVKIGKNVFVGMNSIILKGSVVVDDSVIPAGFVIHR